MEGCSAKSKSSRVRLRGKWAIMVAILFRFTSLEATSSDRMPSRKSSREPSALAPRWRMASSFPGSP